MLACLRVATCLDSSVSFLLFACEKDVKWFLYHLLKLVASPIYDSVVVAVVTVTC